MCLGQIDNKYGSKKKKTIILEFWMYDISFTICTNLTIQTIAILFYFVF